MFVVLLYKQSIRQALSMNKNSSNLMYCEHHLDVIYSLTSREVVNPTALIVENKYFQFLMLDLLFEGSKRS
ncbi:hypothetical protein BD408DRAFT_416199 [Parasitella parasitica]|nr:hypothetical protein BD408DRAFT_416199 [Parasitella parasitica]